VKNEEFRDSVASKPYFSNSIAIKKIVTENMSDTLSGVTGGSSMVIDHNHPLFLGAGDTPGVVQIGIQLVGMENYSLWS